MTFADLIYKGFVWVEGKFTRILGVAAGTLAVLAGTGIIPESHLKYYTAAIAVMTFWRGQATSKVYNQAQAVLAANPSSTQPVTPASTSIKS
jgi:hypothetical protein